MTHVSVREWGRVPITEKPTKGAFTVREAEALVGAARAHPLGGKDGMGILADHRHYLKAQQTVGVIAAPGCSLEILPKVDPDAFDEDAPTVRARLISLLDLALGLDIRAGEAAALTHGAESLLDILIRIFAERLLTETRRGLPRRYVDVEDDLTAIRGRLDLTRQFTHNAVRPDRLACRYDELSHNTPLMQIMAAAVVMLRKHSRVAATQRLLDELRFVLTDVSLLPPSALPWDKVWIDRTNQRWASLFALAKLLLKRDWQTTRHDALSRDGLTLLFPMNDLFEAAVAALLRRALAGRGVELVEQGGLRHCLGDWEKDQACRGSVFQTRPDIILRQRGKVLAVIDTKWKALSSDPLDRKSGVSQADVYQLMAYARLYRCKTLVLLYPSKPGARSGEVRRFGIDGGKELLSISCIDLSMDREQVIAALAGLVAELLGTQESRESEARPSASQRELCQ